MNTKTILLVALFFTLAVGDILLLRRRLEAKVKAGLMTREIADKENAYQRRLFIWAVVLCVAGVAGFLTKQN